MGPPQAETILRQAVAMGARRAILLSDRAFAGADTLATSYTLAKAIEKIAVDAPVDLVLTGKQAIVGDTAMLFNTLHREGSNLAMVSCRLAAETILKAKRAGDFSRPSLEDYARRLEDGIVLQDMKKYRRFNGFLQRHKEIFTTLPRAAGYAGREMLTVDGVSKKAKQGIIWRRLRRDHSLLGLLRLLRDLARSL
jgi:flavin-dependent dehydrogenase